MRGGRRLRRGGGDNSHIPPPSPSGPADEEGGNIRRQEEAVGSSWKGKTLCPHGMACLARMELFPHPPGLVRRRPYTGLLSPGRTVEHCLVRLSSAVRPPGDSTATSAIGRAFLRAAGDKLRHSTLFPTAAIKAFRGWGGGGGEYIQTSGNLLFAGCKVGQREADYFAHCQCTQLTERMPKPLKPFVRKFWTYSDYPLSLGVSEFCSADDEGRRAVAAAGEEDQGGDINFPFTVIIRPVASCRGEEGGSDRSAAPSPSPSSASSSSTSQFDAFLTDMESIPPGTALFDLYACPDPESVPDPSRLERIGRITSTSNMIPSHPDDGLFFRHQRKEEDYALRPEWRDDVRRECTPDGGKTRGTVAALAGWELFEGHIAKGGYVDFETEV